MGSGKTAIGCGAFGLIGVLATVGVMVALFLVTRDALTAGHEDDGPPPTTIAVDDLPPMAATVDPAEGLGEHPEVAVTTSGWAIGTELTVQTCLVDAARVVARADACDEESAVTHVTDGDGALDTLYEVDRVVSAGGLPYDCAAGSVSCAVVVSGYDRDGRERTATARITFAGGLPAPDILEELTG